MDPGYIWYEVWWNASNKNLQSTIVSIMDVGTPMILHVKPITTNAGRTSYTNTSVWPYYNKESGHYMSISGYSGSGAQIEVTDPYILWTSVGKSDSRYNGGKYLIDFNVLDPVADRVIT